MSNEILTSDMQQFVTALIREQGDYLQAQLTNPGELQFHDPLDFSTKFDDEVERNLQAKLAEKYPEIGFYGEELAELRDTSRRYTWYLDPIDGTKYFGRGVPFYSVTLALTEQTDQGRKVLFGVVYWPVAQQLFWAQQGAGAFLNDQKLVARPAQNADLKNVILGVSLGNADRAWEAATLARLYRQIGRLRIFGSDALGLAWLAQGSVTAFIDLSGAAALDKYQDFAASTLIACETGAQQLFVPTAVGSHLLVAPANITESLRELIIRAD